jgi:hypothetical protein
VHLSLLACHMQLINKLLTPPTSKQARPKMTLQKAGHRRQDLKLVLPPPLKRVLLPYYPLVPGSTGVAKCLHQGQAAVCLVRCALPRMNPLAFDRCNLTSPPALFTHSQQWPTSSRTTGPWG